MCEHTNPKTHKHAQQVFSEMIFGVSKAAQAVEMNQSLSQFTSKRFSNFGENQCVKVLCVFAERK